MNTPGILSRVKHDFYVHFDLSRYSNDQLGTHDLQHLLPVQEGRETT